MFKKLLHGKRKSALLNLTWSGLLCRVVWSVSQLLYLLQRAGHFKFFSPSFFVGLELTLRGIFDCSSQLKMLPSLVQLKLLGEADRLSRRFYGSGWASRRYACNSSTTASTCGSASILK